MKIQLLCTVSPAMKGPTTIGLPLAQLEYWTLVPSYHLMWVSAAGGHRVFTPSLTDHYTY